MRTDNLNLASKLLKHILLAGAILYVVVYLVVVFYRIRYPFELMWQEGAAVDHVRKILSDYKYYVRPSLEFVPSIYTPLYFYFSAVVSSIIGVGFMPLRFVSFISSIGNFLIIYLIVKRETDNTFSGIIASCLFAATFEISGAWFDLARADSLSLLFLLTALYFIRFKVSLKSYIFAGVLISLSFLTKQTALIVSLPVMLYPFIVNRRYSIIFISTTIFILIVSTIFLEYIHDGWYTYYIFLASDLPLIKSRFISFWTKDLFSTLPIACILSLYYLIYTFFQHSDSSKKDFLFYFLAASSMIGISWGIRLFSGAWLNDLIPAYAIISIMSGLASHRLLESALRVSQTKQKFMEICIYLVLIIQFVSPSLMYNPLRQVPTKKDLEAGKSFINKMMQIEGEIFMNFHGYLPVLAGKKSYANQMGMRDVLASDKKSQVRIELLNEIRHAMREKKFAAIIIDSFEPWYPPDMEKYYIKKEKIFSDDTVFYPVVAMKTRPEFIYVPKSDDWLDLNE